MTVGVGGTAKFWATAEAEGFVSLCGGPISYTQEDPAPEGGGGGGGGGGSGGGSSSGGEKAKAPRRLPMQRKANCSATSLPAPGSPSPPPSKTRSRNPVFRFTDSTGQVGTRFRCKVDGHAWKRCSSPLRAEEAGPLGRTRSRSKRCNALGTPELHPAEAQVQGGARDEARLRRRLGVHDSEAGMTLIELLVAMAWA